MKKLFVLISSLIFIASGSLHAQAQPTTIPTQLGNNYYYFPRYVNVASGLMFPDRDTTYTLIAPGITHYQGQFFLWSTYANKWYKINTGADGGGSGISQLGISPYGLSIVNDSTYKVDTSATRIATKPFVRSKVDSLLALILARMKYTDTATMLSGYRTYYPRSAISLTTTGSSGAATYNQATGVFNIPVYSGGGGGSGISQLGTSPYGLTIVNDSTYRADTSAPAGLATKPHVRSKVDSLLDLILARMRYSDTASMLSGYKTYYPRAAISLTTTGSSGAATYNTSTGVLNVPQYTGGGGGTVTDVTASSPIRITSTSTITPNVVADTTQNTNFLVNHGRLKQKLDSISRTVDSLISLITLLTQNVPGNGSAKQISFVDDDTLKLKGLADGTFTTVTTRSDSANKVNADTAAMRTWIETFVVGGGWQLSYDSTYGNETDSIWVDTSFNGGRLAYRWRGKIFHVANSDSIPGTPPVSFDSDAEAFFTAAGITDPDEQEDYNDLVVALKSNGTSGTNKYAKRKAIYPFLGGTATTTKYNAADPQDTDAAYRITWSGGWDYTNGVTGNGSTGTGNTHLTPNVDFSSLNAYFGAYISSNVQADTYDFGAYSAGNGMFLSSRQNDGKYYSAANAPISAGTTTSTSIGYYSSSHTAGPVNRTFKDGVNVLTDAAADQRVAYEIKVGCVNIAGTDGGFSNRKIGILLFFEGLTVAEDTDVYNAVLTFVTARGRN